MKRIQATLGAMLVAALAVVLFPVTAQAHVERPAYWPDPAPDCSITPCAGGQVPAVRPLSTALDARAAGDTRVVCRPDSMERLRASVAKALVDGYYVRPTHKATLTRAQGDALLKTNARLFKACEYDEIQPAVTASGNNDRVVVMPGLYTEPTARSQPTHDPACDQYEMNADSGDPGALSHDYQIHCPNDANLVAVIGRGPDTAPPAGTPSSERHGIPGVGECIRCNLQLEGSGVSADDVVVEAGDPAAGNGGPSAAGHQKDVGIFADRADGFVLRGMTVRHAREHDIYVLETDGYRLEHFKVYYAGGYGVLTFVGDHGLVQHCDAAGHGDSGLYPGSGADSTTNRYLPFYPEYRYSQTFQYCDTHHNTGGFSGTNSHGTLIRYNNIYDNSLGITTDVFTAPGHPGFPQHGNVIEHNNIYANNFNAFAPDSDVAPFIPAPVGTGMWIAGGNQNEIRDNRFYDNWRRGLMVFAVPDATVCGPEPVGSNTPVPGCDPAKVSTSFDNRVHGNVMGLSPEGQALPNGTDFWWDSFPGNTGNCWWGNTAAPGAKVTSNTGLPLPDCLGGTAPQTSIGTGNPVAEAELVACFAGFIASDYPYGEKALCDWTVDPAPPGSGSGPADATAQRQVLADTCTAGLAPRTCEPYGNLLTGVIGAVTNVVADATSPVALAAPKPSEGVLSGFTCSWWRAADDGERHGIVDRIQAFASGPVNGRAGDQQLGYGAAMNDGRAARFLEDRCSTFQAGPLALYKLYGAAAAFLAES